MFVNFVVGLVVLLVMLLLPFLVICLFPPCRTIKKLPYSIIYNKMHASGKLVFLEHFLRIFKAPLFITVIFAFRDISSLLPSLILLGYMLFYLVITAINFRKYFNQLYWAFSFTKSLLLLSFQIAFLFIPTL